MKRIGSTLLAAGLIAALAGGNVFAADKKGKAETGACEFRMGKRAKKLGLTEEQAKKIRELRKEAREAVKPLRKELKEKMRELKRQVRAMEGDDKIAATLKDVEKARKALRSAKEKQRGKIESLLTPGQRAKVLLAQAKRGKKGRRGMRGKGRRFAMRHRGRFGGGRGWKGRGSRGFGRGRKWRKAPKAWKRHRRGGYGHPMDY